MSQPSGLRNPAAAVRGVGAGTLVVEALVLLLALLPLARLGGEHATAGIWLCAALVAVSVVLAGLLRRPWAWWAGLVVPLALIVGGVVVSWALVALGVLYALAWTYVLNVRHTVLSGPPPAPPVASEDE
jgi:Protein of unknown function (DUF4233)